MSSPSDWWRYYGYMQLYSARTRVGGIAVAWTLCVEVTFYIALPIWAWAVRRLPRGEGVRGMLRGELVVLALVAVGGIAVQLAAAKQLVPYALGISIVGQATWLCLGMALAVLSVGSDHDSSFRGLRAAGDHAAWCWVVSALAFFGLIALVPSGGLFGLLAQTQSLQGAGSTLAHIVLSAVFVTLLVLPAIFDKGRTRVPHRLLGLVPLVWLGTISYSFYLFHLTIAQLIAWPSAPGLFSASGLDLLAHVHTLRTVVLFTVSPRSHRGRGRDQLSAGRTAVPAAQGGWERRRTGPAFYPRAAMIVFGCSITAPDVYALAAEPGFRLVAEPDSEIIANAAAGSLFRSYNLILDMVAEREDLEALVLVHQDAEIVDRHFCAKVREALKDPDVGWSAASGRSTCATSPGGRVR